MPNHIHGVVIITDRDGGQSAVGAPLVGAPSTAPTPHIGKHASGGCPATAPRLGAPGPNGASTRDAPTPSAGSAGSLSPSLGDIVGAFKSITTVAYVRGVEDLGWPPFDTRLWQRNYYERIVRDDRELDRIRQYIEDNPIHWAEDAENPGQQKPAAQR
jgi:putative transposase